MVALASGLQGEIGRIEGRRKNNPEYVNLWEAMSKIMSDRLIHGQHVEHD